MCTDERRVLARAHTTAHSYYIYVRIDGIPYALLIQPEWSGG